MSGVSAFINRIAYITPSGSPPKLRMIITRIPIPAPKIQQPRWVMGDVTGSVAIKIAPNISPPERR